MSSAWLPLNRIRNHSKGTVTIARYFHYKPIEHPLPVGLLSFKLQVDKTD